MHRLDILMTPKCSAMVVYLHCVAAFIDIILLMWHSASSPSIVALLLQGSWAPIVPTHYYKITRERKFININAILWGKGVPVFYLMEVNIGSSLKCWLRVVVQGVKGLETKCRSASELPPLPKYLPGLLQWLV